MTIKKQDKEWITIYDIPADPLKVKSTGRRISCLGNTYTFLRTFNNRCTKYGTFTLNQEQYSQFIQNEYNRLFQK